MHLPVKLILGLLLGTVVYVAGVEVVQAEPGAKLPPGTVRVSFGDLADVTLPADSGRAKAGDYLKALPGAVRRLDNQQVFLEGFMIPTQLEGRMVSQFLLVRNQASCCFGFPLGLADAVLVHMQGHPVGSLMDRPLAVVGRLRVREQWDGSVLESIYQMDGERVNTNGLDQASSPAATPTLGRE